MQPLTAYIKGIGLVGPGMDLWPDARAILRAERPYSPQATRLQAPAALPATERRRAGTVVRLALTAGLEAIAAAGHAPQDLATVFASSGADGSNCHAICATLASGDPLLSPTRFHNSVSNAAAGYWSIATQASAPSTVVCAHDASFGAGLIEALAQVVVDQRPCLLIAYDAAYPEPLYSVRPIPDAFGIALLLSPDASSAGAGRISARLGDETADTLQDAALESLRRAIPAARSLPLLQCLARSGTGRVVLDYLPGSQLLLELTP
jgi:hypothetical protein